VSFGPTSLIVGLILDYMLSILSYTTTKSTCPGPRKNRDRTPYESQKWASVKSMCEFPLLQMWSFNFLNSYIKFNLFFLRKSKCDSTLLTLLYITHFCFDVYVVFIEIFYPSWIWCVQKMQCVSLKGLKIQRFYKISIQSDA
jgi:hypothetical protein